MARRPWIWILQVVSCDLEFRLLSVQALFLMPKILEIAFSRLYLCVYILFFFLGGGGVWTIPPPLSKKEPYILFLNLFCYTVGSRVLKVLLKPQSNKLICNRKKLVDKKLFLLLILLLFFILGIGNPKGSSIVVRYQHDINYLRDMARNTVEGYDLWVKIIISYKFSVFFFYFNIQWHWLPPEKLKKSWILNS